jgi:hypothetical protein
METSEHLRLRLLSQQEALNAAISSLRAVTGTTPGAGAATCTEPHTPQEKACDNDTSRTDRLVAAPNPATPSTPAPVTPEGPNQKEFDDLKQALADALKNTEDMKKKLDSSQPLSSTTGLPADAASLAEANSQVTQVTAGPPAYRHTYIHTYIQHTYIYIYI